MYAYSQSKALGHQFINNNFNIFRPKALAIVALGIVGTLAPNQSIHVFPIQAFGLNADYSAPWRLAPRDRL